MQFKQVSAARSALLAYLPPPGYVNGRFHTALSAGNYTVSCLPTGLHTLSSLDNPIA